MRKVIGPLLALAIQGSRKNVTAQKHLDALLRKGNPSKPFGAAPAAHSLAHVHQLERREGREQAVSPWKTLALLLAGQAAAFKPVMPVSSLYRRGPAWQGPRSYLQARHAVPATLELQATSLNGGIRGPGDEQTTNSPSLQSSSSGIAERAKLERDLLAEYEDPHAKVKANDEKRRNTEFMLNVGEAIDSLHHDIPRILEQEPNWGIYTDDLILDLAKVDPVVLRLMTAVTPIEDATFKGLELNKYFYLSLRNFQKMFFEMASVRVVRIRKTVDIDGEPVIDCRWTAKIDLKQDPTARLVQRGLQKMFPDLTDNDSDATFTMDAISRFYLNSQGRINRHVLDNVQLRPPLEMLDVNELLSRVGRTVPLVGARGAIPA